MPKILKKLKEELKIRSAKTVAGICDALATNRNQRESADISQMEDRVMLSATPMVVPVDANTAPTATPVALDSMADDSGVITLSLIHI